MDIFGFDIEIRDRRAPKHLRNRNLNQITLRRDIALMCSDRKKLMTYKEMSVVTNDMTKALKRLSKEYDTQKGE